MEDIGCRSPNLPVSASNKGEVTNDPNFSVSVIGLTDSVHGLSGKPRKSRRITLKKILS